MTVPTFKGERQLAIDTIEFGSQGNEFPNTFRSVVNDLLDDVGVAHALAGRNRIGNMTCEVVERIQYSGDTTLSVCTVGLLQLIFGHDDRLQSRVHSQSGPDARNPASDHQNIGELVRDFARIKRH